MKPPGGEVSEQQGVRVQGQETGEPWSSGWTASGFPVRSESDIHLPTPTRPPQPPHPSLLSPGTGVTVNALHPGVARTELGRHTGMHSSAFSSFTLGKRPLLAWGPLSEPLPCQPGAQEPPAGR